MIVIEDVLRATFEERAQRSPALDDPAGVALRRARRILRRRRVGTSVAGVAAMLALSGTLVWAQGQRVDMRYGISGIPVPYPSTAPAPASAPATAPASRPTVLPEPGRRPGVDLFAEGQVWTADGRHLSVVPPDWEVLRAYRVPAGWLVGGRDETLLVAPDGSSVRLALGERWLVSADGTRVAYLVDTTLRVATLGPEGLQEAGWAQVAPGTAPIAFAGERIVLGLLDGTGKLTNVDHWQPGHPYRPTWRQPASRVYELPDGNVLAQVPSPSGGPGCLSRLAVAADDGALRAQTPVACGVEPVDDGPPVAAVSPNGRWLAVPGPATVNLYDLTTVFDRPVATATCAAPASAGLAWEGVSAVLASDGSRLVRCGLDGRTEPVALPADLPAGWRLVPDRPSPSVR